MSQTLADTFNPDIRQTDKNDSITLEQRPRREVALKIAIQQLHLVIIDYIEKSSNGNQLTQVEDAQKNII